MRVASYMSLNVCLHEALRVSSLAPRHRGSAWLVPHFQAQCWGGTSTSILRGARRLDAGSGLRARGVRIIRWTEGAVTPMRCWMSASAGA